MEMVYNIRYRGQDHETPEAAIRKGPWKYIKRSTGFSGWSPCPPEMCFNQTINDAFDVGEDAYYMLFNVVDDPTESINLYDSEPEIFEDLDMLLEEYIAALPDEPYPKQDPSGDPSNFGGAYSYGWC